MQNREQQCKFNINDILFYILIAKYDIMFIDISNFDIFNFVRKK